MGPTLAWYRERRVPNLRYYGVFLFAVILLFAVVSLASGDGLSMFTNG